MRSLLLLLAILRCDSFAAFVYSPGSSGSSSNLFPFGLGAGGMRYQQVYAAGQFGGLSGGGCKCVARSRQKLIQLLAPGLYSLLFALLLQRRES